MSIPKPAGTAEILRASQTDEVHLRYMRNLFSEIVQRCLGIPTWMKWKDLCDTFSNALYSLTTLSGLQTLGEEYANIIQVDRSLKSVPSKWARTTDVALQTFGFYFLSRIQSLLENQLSTTPSPSGDDIIAILHAHLPKVFRALAVLLRVHLIAFYFYGNCHSLSKRLTGIRYIIPQVVIRRWLSNPASQSPYRLLGWIATAQMCLSMLVMMHASAATNETPALAETPKEDSGDVNSRNQCSLCFEKRSHSTATPCGHLFCWSCITSWMQNKEECPLCRESFAPSKLICLQNYY